jgi:hypothetical protein
MIVPPINFKEVTIRKDSEKDVSESARRTSGPVASTPTITTPAQRYQPNQ